MWVRVPPAAFLIVLCLCAAPATAATPESLDRKLDRAFRDANIPGTTATLVDDGSVARKGASGRSDVERRAPMKPSARYPIASTTKSEVAAMVMRLVEDVQSELD